MQTDCVNAIDARHLAKNYGEVTAVADLTLQVPRGEIFGFLGPNGAGKTTSVKMLTGLAKPTSGFGMVLGAPIGDRATRARLGYLPELFRYQEWLSARETLRFHAHISSVRNASTTIPTVLRTVGLEARADDRVGTYSKGMQQRLGLAVALLGEPELVILDEPTSALDPAGRHDVRAILLQLKARGTAVFLNSHLLTEIEQICDRVAVVSHGHVVAQGSIAEIIGLQHAVRVRAKAGTTPLATLLERFGRVASNDGEYVVNGVSSECVPQLVAALVAEGAQVFAVEPLTVSLEERFLQITRERP